MIGPKLTCAELAERMRRLETQHASALEQIEQYKSALAESAHGQEAYELLCQHGRDTILFIRCRDARIVDVNEAAVKAYGYSRNELLSLRIHDIRYRAIGQLIESQLREADLTGILFETIHCRKDGTTFPVEVSSIGGELNGERCAVSIVRDISVRKEIEKDIRIREERFRKIFEESPVGILFLDDQRRILNMNRRFCEFVGYSPSEIRDRGLVGILHPDEWQPTMEMSARMRSGEIPFFRKEQRHIRTDEEIVWSDTFITALRDPDGKVIQTIAWVQDITERKRAEEALKSSELKYRSLFEAADDGIFLQNSAGFIDCNAAGARMYGIAKEEVIGKSPLDFCPEYQPDGRLSTEVATEKVSKVLQGTTQKFEWAYRRMDGAVFDVEITLSRIGDVGSTLLLAIVRDITERKQAQQALKRSQANFAEAQRQTHIGSFEYRFGTRQVEWSDEMFRIFGIERTEFRGKKEDFLTRVHPEDVRHVDAAIEKWLYQTGPLDLGLRIVRPNGEIRNIRMILENDFDKSGHPLRTIGTFQDITEQMQAESERARLESQLRQAQKMESIGRLAGGVAHDFNNMLGVILGHVELALEQLGPAEPLLEDLRGIQKAARHSADLTRQLLAFARKQTIAPQILDLNETISTTLKMLQRMIGENIQLKWQPVENLWTVKADPFQIDQILANLCVNARDAIPDVGEITIAAENRVVDADYCSTREDLVPGEYVRLAVSDNGCGMGRDVLEHIFEPFFTTKAMGQGTGLGLAMVYGAVKQNNGFIHVESNLEAGTAFSIYLPRQRSAAQKPTPKAQTARQGKETILLVEDEQGFLNLVTILLSKQGYNVLAAGGPTEAIRLAKDHPDKIDLLMTDVIMPEMNGRILAQTLQSLYPDIKCLFMSGYTADIVASQGILDEGVAFIQKPFSKKELADKLSAMLG